jgi:uncharacterized integral membrane protein
MDRRRLDRQDAPMNSRQILGLVLLLALVVFFVKNSDEALVWFFGIRMVMPIAVVVLFSAAVGAGAMWALGRVRGRSR